MNSLKDITLESNPFFSDAADMRHQRISIAERIIAPGCFARICYGIQHEKSRYTKQYQRQSGPMG